MLLRSLALAIVLLAPSAASAAIMTTVPATATTPPVAVYIVRPDGAGPFPTVVILHGCDGFSGFDAVAADRLIALGYAAVAIDGFGPKFPNGACSDTDNAGYVAEMKAAQATFAWLHSQPFVASNRLAGIGFSSGADVLLALIDSTRRPATPHRSACAPR
jgi:dienelactone hydrolase